MAITNADLTQGQALTRNGLTVTGTGVFDDIMEAINIHLDAQFNANRITGEAYATTYTALVKSALESGVQFLRFRDVLGKEEDKLDQEIELFKQRIITEYAETEQTTKTSPKPNSVIGKTKIISDQQAKAFKWENDINYAKMLIDAFTANTALAEEPDKHLPQIRQAATTIDTVPVEDRPGRLKDIVDAAKPS